MGLKRDQFNGGICGMGVAVLVVPEGLEVVEELEGLELLLE